MNKIKNSLLSIIVSNSLMSQINVITNDNTNVSISSISKTTWSNVTWQEYRENCRKLIENQKDD